MKNIAIKFEKIFLGENRFLFKPVGIIKGVYNKKSKKFTSDNSEVYYLINGNNPNKSKYFYAPTSLKELKETYGNYLSIKELISEYYSICNDICFIGIYDEIRENINIFQIPFYRVEKIALKARESNNSNRLKDIKTLKEAKNVIKSARNNLNPEDYKIEWFEETPYMVLNIENNNYSNEELLEFVRRRIDHIKRTEKSSLSAQCKIDKILDAYNEIIGEKRYHK